MWLVSLDLSLKINDSVSLSNGNKYLVISCGTLRRLAITRGSLWLRVRRVLLTAWGEVPETRQTIFYTTVWLQICSPPLMLILNGSEHKYTWTKHGVRGHLSARSVTISGLPRVAPGTSWDLVLQRDTSWYLVIFHGILWHPVVPRGTSSALFKVPPRSLKCLVALCGTS